MRINHNVSSMVTQGSLYKTGVATTKSLEKLSTGLRINRASDDAAGLGVSENLRTQVKGTAQAKKNAIDGIAALNIAEGAANEISGVLQRMRELAVQSANDTLTSTERSYTNTEYAQLTSEISRITSVTKYNKQNLLDGTGFGSAAATGSNKLWIDAGSTPGTDSMTITIDKIDATTLGVAATAAINLTNQGNAVTAIGLIDIAINSVNTMRSKVGAYTNRLEHAISNLDVSNTNQQAAESQIRDVDFASETSEFTKNQILSQSATAMLAQSNQLPQGVLSLLR